MAPPSIKYPSASGEDRPGALSGDGLSLLCATAVRSRLVMVFCVLALIATAANIKLVADLMDWANVSREVAATRHPVGHSPGMAATPASNPSTGLKIRLAFLFGTVVVCFAAMIYLFIGRVILPLSAIFTATDQMAKGNLSVTAPSHFDGELGDLSHVINNLAINFQEVLLLTGTAIGNTRAAVDKIQETLDRGAIADGNDLREQITALKKDLDMLGTVIKDFQFYQTRFDGRKVVSHGSGRDG